MFRWEENYINTFNCIYIFFYFHKANLMINVLEKCVCKNACGQKD